MIRIPKDELPPQLSEIPEPPEYLWCEGVEPAKDGIYLVVVGSRHHTNYGKEVCQKLIEGLRGYPITIVSGLAIGIDTIAHQAALQAELKTIAFPGSGLSNSVLYPKSNWRLANEIVLHGGCLLSELPPETAAAPWTFPKRNRLMAGIAHACLIIEATEKSGTLITARLGLDYNREVMCVPGPIFSLLSSGTNRLIKEGAMPVTSSEDIIDALGLDRVIAVTKRAPENTTPEEEHILALLTEPKDKDMLIRELALPAQEVNSLLSVMEIKGLIRDTGVQILRTH
jgi:DNA processing protein